MDFTKLSSDRIMHTMVYITHTNSSLKIVCPIPSPMVVSVSQMYRTEVFPMCGST